MTNQGNVGAHGVGHGAGGFNIGEAIATAGETVTQANRDFLNSIKLMSSLSNTRIRGAVDAARLPENQVSSVEKLRAAADSTLDANGNFNKATPANTISNTTPPQYFYNTAEEAEMAQIGFDLLGKAGVALDDQNAGLYYGIMTGSMPVEQAVSTIEWAVSKIEITSAQSSKLLRKMVDLTRSCIQKLQGS